MNKITIKTSVFTILVNFSILFSPFKLHSQIIDSDITLEKALEETLAPREISDKLTLLDVEYYSSDNQLHKGQILIDSMLTSDVKEIFEFIKNEKFIIEMVIPVKFDMPDGMTSMANLNNTYSFHYRKKIGSQSISVHALGQAIDFNPFYNPYINTKGDVIPKGAQYDTSHFGTLTKASPLVKKLISLGWTWGGNWDSPKDYMHFQKRLE